MSRLRSCCAAFRRFPSPAKIALVAWIVTMVGMAPAWAAPIQTVGIGDLLPIYHPPAGSTPSLLEAIAPGNYSLDLGPTVLDQATGTGILIAGANGLINMVFGLAQLAVYAAIALVQWIVGLTQIPGLNNLVTTTLGTGAAALMSWLGPTALAIGALVAFAQRRTNEGFGQVLWVIVAMVMGLTLAIAPSAWVTSTQQVRSVATQAMLAPAAATGLVSPKQQSPFAWPATDYAGAPDVRAMRIAGDATWRALVVVPWCVIEFGSTQACKQYGLPILQETPGSDARKTALDRMWNQQGDDSPTTRWSRGYDWPQRGLLALGVLVMNLIVCGLLLSLAFTALSALVGTALHLMVGVPFALTWCIPGAPRRIGMRWLESLIGTIIQSALATGLIGIVLTLTTLIYSNIDEVGGIVAAAILAGAVAFSAIKFRRLVESWFDIVQGGHGGAALLGAMALRMVSRSVTRLVRGVKGDPGSSPGRPRTNSDQRGGDGSDGSSGPAGPRGSSTPPNRRRNAALPRSRRGDPAPTDQRTRPHRPAPVRDRDQATRPQRAATPPHRSTNPSTSRTEKRVPPRVPPKRTGATRPPRRTAPPTDDELHRAQVPTKTRR